MKFQQIVWMLIPTMQLYHCKSSAECNNLTQYYKVGRCCDKCLPGAYMEKQCTRRLGTRCTGCEPHHYQSDWNTLHYCRRHTYCDPNGGFETKSEGNSTHNAVCICAGGKHCANKDCEVCMDDAPREQAVTPADNWPKDSECEPCQPGFYPEFSCAVELCKPWTDCGPKGQLQPGNATSDAICNSSTDLSVIINVVIGAGCLVVVLLVLIVGGVYRTVCNTKWPGSLLGKTKKAVQQQERDNNNCAHVILWDHNGCAREVNMEKTSVPETQMPGQLRYSLITASQEEGKESHLPEQEWAS